MLVKCKMNNCLSSRFMFFLFCLFSILCSYICVGEVTNSVANSYFDRTYEFGVTYQLILNNTSEYIFYCDSSEDCIDDFPARISVLSENSNVSNPVFVTARQQKGVLSWQVPLIIEKEEMKNVSRTLCPNKNILLNFDKNVGNVQFTPIIHIYTSSQSNVTVYVKVDRVLDFNLQFNVMRNVSVSPANPVVYFYSFTGTITNPEEGSNYVKNGDAEELSESALTSYYRKQKKNFKELSSRVLQNLQLDDTQSSVLVHVTSDDDTCMLMSIQNASCPIFDTERELTYEGYYATISKQGGISVSRRNYPDGFYIVLVVRSDDQECTGATNGTFFEWRSREFDSTREFIISNRLTREKPINIAILGSVSFKEYMLGVSSLTILMIVVYLIVLITLVLFNRASEPLTMTSVDFFDSEQRQLDGRNVCMGQSALDIAAMNYGIRSRDTESIDGELEQTEQIYLNELCTRDTMTLKRQSNMFLWHLITVAVFYGLPVIQLVITYQRVLNQTGNQDQCYYNFLCANPLGFFSDFNHIYSNTGYILLGFLFIIIVWRRKKLHHDSEFDANFGIPQHYGLYYAMGGALIMEGILSGSYHICPNHTNFQFDTSFMYVMAVLCMVKIYQSRHPDVNARAHVTFGVLAATVFIGLIGVLFPNFYFWLFFTIIHISTCLMLSLNVYYMGKFKVELICCKQCVCGGICRPAFRSRCVMAIIGNVCNWCLAGYGLYLHSKDFASHLLYLFLMNLALYMFWYLIMKLINNERPRWYSWVLFVLASITWVAALYFFFDGSTSWSLTPAQSRVYNTHCVILNFYDNHDIWHILSAAAMFFGFLLFLTMDDDVSHIRRDKIPVF